MIYDVIVCGGGASGFFSAINIALKVPKSKILIIEKSSKLLSKVKISGGGRCNVTNGRELPSELVKFYPRGEKKLYALMKTFGSKEMKEWLNAQQVSVKTENDLRVFPTSDSSQTIIDCFLNICHKYKIEILTNHEAEKIEKNTEYWDVKTKKTSFRSKILVFATGSSPKTWNLLKKTPFNISTPVPSLFTFNIKDPRLINLPGVAFNNASVKIEGTKFEENGPLLITHWGLSGPAILKLSAWAARELHSKNYSFNILVNFNQLTSPESFKKWFSEIRESNPNKKITNLTPEGMTNRYWANLLTYCSIDQNIQVKSLSKKNINKLVEESCQAKFEVNGKSTFKEEFVTCGGINLNEINLKTMESKNFTNLYFAGEVLDIDGITGGFNFQACWATGWTLSESISEKLSSE